MDLTLTPTERNTPLWQKLVKHYEARLATLRAKNDNSKPETETERLRGQIAECKEFLRLGQDAPVYEQPIPRIDAGPDPKRLM